MLHHPDDTIAAIATAAGGAASGIVRVSGPDALRCVSAVLDAGAEPLAEVVTGSRVVTGRICSIPCEFYVWPTNRSYTRAPTVEIHTLGSPPLLQIVLNAMCSAGARVAQPGEFTLRAFLAGRLDLTQAEAVLGVIDATGDSELRAALTQLAGGLSRPLHALRDGLLDLLAELEAGLDFAEEDLQFISARELHARLNLAATKAEAMLGQIGARSDAADAFRVALVGSPNVGKSSLFNALVGEQAALVSHISGTTRDYLSARLALDGVAVELIDTAGVEEDNEDSPETSIATSAQTMTADQHARANLRLVCLDSTRPLNAWERAKLTKPAPSMICVGTKVDAAEARRVRIRASDMPLALRGDEIGCTDTYQFGLPADAIFTSSGTGAGLNELRSRLREIATSTEAGQVVAGTAARCRESLLLAHESLLRAGDLAERPGREDLISAEVRVALVELGRVAGVVYTDDILDRIFSRFCIGK